jgi:hypothetical protein
MFADGLVPSNLFAIEYLKEHPATTKLEFKRLWDNITSETKKVCKQHQSTLVIVLIFHQKYEALSKERKSAARLPATTRVTANGSNTDD